MNHIRTYDDINKKIENGEAVVVTADEIVGMVKEEGLKRVADYVDVVTTGTFSPMCSSGIFLNFGHAEPPIRMQKIFLNEVPTHGGLAAVDTYLGATNVSRTSDTYGGSHVIEELLEGKDVNIKATSVGTDCYPRKEINTWINLESVNEAIMYNPRNCYQNYNVAVNASDKSIRTYMGTLLPKMGNAHFATSGQLSPLLKDRNLQTIGIGTRIFLCGAQGYVAWNGTQHNPQVQNIDGKTIYSGGTLAVTGNFKEMSTRYLRAAYFLGYGVSMYVGVGIPIPILSLDILKDVSISDEELYTKVMDYSSNKVNKPILGVVSYKELREGSINLGDKEVQSSPVSSYARALEICERLKGDIESGGFLLQELIQKLPTKATFRNLRGG